VQFLGLQQRGRGFVWQRGAGVHGRLNCSGEKAKGARGLLFTPGISCKGRRAIFPFKKKVQI